VVSGNWTAAGFCFLLAITSVALAYLQHRRSEGGGTVITIETGEAALDSSSPVYDGMRSEDIPSGGRPAYIQKTLPAPGEHGLKLAVE
jgi:ACS family pantothenate transporter-like MFS transporter